MKNIKYIILLLLSIGFMHSCDLVNNETDLDLNDKGNNVVTFERIKSNLTMTATGEEKTMTVNFKIVGPTVSELTSDIKVTFSADESSTAVENDHYRIENKTITLKKSNNYLGVLEIILMSEGNSAPMDGTPEFDTYVAPKLYLKMTASGADNVVGSGKFGDFTLNFVPPNPYAGDYSAHLIYHHPSIGDYPDDVYVDEVNDKTLEAVTGRKCETWFATWDTDLCWITINSDNSISFIVDDTWPYDVKLGDPHRPDLVSHFDPSDGKIYLYYHYTGTGGDRIFWETFTPKF